MYLSENCPFDIAPLRVLNSLSRLKEQVGNRRRVALEAGEGYGAFVFDEGGSLEIKVSGGRSLGPDFRLDLIGRRQIIEAGLTQLRASDDFRVVLKHYDDDVLSQWVVTICGLLKSAFGADESDGVSMTAAVSSIPALDDKNLISAMRHLAKVRDWNARKSLYFLLSRSQVILLLEPSGTSADGGQGEIRSVDTLGGGQVAAIFTSQKALDTFDPRPVGLRTAAGRELFPLLMSPTINSVKINPRGTVGGELYRNEIVNIVEGIKRL